MDGDLFVQVVSLFFTVLMMVLVRYLVPWLSVRVSAERLSKIVAVVKMAVYAIEQTFKTSDVSGPEKKVYALEYIRTLGVDINMSEVDALIEAMVYQMNLAKKNIPD